LSDPPQKDGGPICLRLTKREIAVSTLLLFRSTRKFRSAQGRQGLFQLSRPSSSTAFKASPLPSTFSVSPLLLPPKLAHQGHRSAFITANVATWTRDGCPYFDLLVPLTFALFPSLAGENLCMTYVRVCVSTRADLLPLSTRSHIFPSHHFPSGTEGVHLSCIRVLARTWDLTLLWFHPGMLWALSPRREGDRRCFYSRTPPRHFR